VEVSTAFEIDATTVVEAALAPEPPSWPEHSHPAPRRVEPSSPRTTRDWSVRVPSTGTIENPAAHAMALALLSLATGLAYRRSGHSAIIARVRNASPDVPLTVPAQLRRLRGTLGLNKSQLADVLRISRPTLYEWLRGTEPTRDNGERLAMLTRAVQRAGIEASSPLSARFVTQRLPDEVASLFDVLRRPVLDDETVANVLAATLRRSVDERAERARRERELEDLGYEEPSEQRKARHLAEAERWRDLNER
jgi:transcriptional regulator with XRE-family HTH domain